MVWPKRAADTFTAFEEDEEDESQSNQPCGNKYQRRFAGTQVAQR